MTQEIDIQFNQVYVDEARGFIAADKYKINYREIFDGYIMELEGILEGYFHKTFDDLRFDFDIDWFADKESTSFWDVHKERIKQNVVDKIYRLK